MRLSAALLIVAVLPSACATPTRDRRWVEDEVRRRTGHALSWGENLPPVRVDESDGLTADEAAALALAASPNLHAELVALDTALADFREAVRPPNPQVQLRFPADPRTISLLLLWPLDAIWTMPFRVIASTRELERICDALVQVVLDTVRDVHVAHADAWLAARRLDVRRTIAEGWDGTLALVRDRVRDGDAPAIQIDAVRGDVALAHDEIQRADAEVSASSARLRFLIGADARTPVVAVADDDGEAPPASAGTLVERAGRERPDLRAARLGVEAAAARARWERSRVLNLIGVLDVETMTTGMTGATGGIRIDLPILNQNRGGIGRADAEVRRAGLRYAALRLAVIADVVDAEANRGRSRRSVATFRDEVLPALRAAHAGALASWRSGSDTFFPVLDAERRMAEGRLRLAELQADVLRARARLARAVGGPLVDPESKP